MILEEIEKAHDERYIVTDESYVSGFDPETKKGWKAKNTTYRYSVLIGYGKNDYMVGHRTKIIFDNGTTVDWHWKETIPENPIFMEPLEINNNN